MENSHKNIPDNLHLRRVVLIGVVYFPEDIYDGKSGVAMLNDLSQPGAVHMIKNVNGEFHVFRVDSVEFPAEVNL